MSPRELRPTDHIAQYALLCRLIAAALALVAAAGFGERGRVGLVISVVVIVVGNYLALRNWPYVVDVLRVRDKPLYLVLDVALALTVVLTVGSASPLVLYLIGSAVLAGLVYRMWFALAVSVVVAVGYLAALLLGLGAARGDADVHAVFTLPALLLGAGPAAAMVRRLLLLRERDAQAVTALRAQMAVREERLRLSRDMHDGITKNLHGMALLAGGLHRHLDRGRPEQAREVAELIAMTARQLAESSREVILDLREVDPAEPVRALRETVDGAVAGHDLNLHWQVSDDAAARLRDLPAEIATQLRAVVGEAVHNVVKHAAASSVTVTGAIEVGGVDGTGRGDLVLLVRDDGRGLCPEQAAAAAAAGHLGMVGMAERMRRIGGRLDARTASGGGTAVTLRLPADAAGAARAPGPRVGSVRPVIEGAAHG